MTSEGREGVRKRVELEKVDYCSNSRHPQHLNYHRAKSQRGEAMRCRM